jgi:hypothetical protein
VRQVRPGWADAELGSGGTFAGCSWELCGQAREQDDQSLIEFCGVVVLSEDGGRSWACESRVTGGAFHYNVPFPRKRYTVGSLTEQAEPVGVMSGRKE